MRVSEDGLKLIQAYEGLGDGNPNTVLLEPYVCPAHVWTVGWGYALKTPSGQIIDQDVFGKAKAAQLAVEAMQRRFGKQAITAAEADILLREEIGAYERGVEKALGKGVAGTSQHQFDAMVSFAYNLGVGNFDASAVKRLHAAGNRRIGDVSLGDLYRKSVNKADPSSMPVAYVRWSNAQGKWMLGLFRRRLAEMMVYGGHDLATALATTRNWKPA